MSRVTIADVVSWGIDYPVNGDALTILHVRHVVGVLWSN